MENEQIKRNKLGHFYGSRISKNGQWLNLIIVLEDGERVTCPIRLAECDNKPHAICEGKRASVQGIPVFDEPKKEEKKEGEIFSKGDPADGLPF